jgi:hypothetical protein
MQTLFGCLPKVISKKYEKFIPLNVNALKEGESFAKSALIPDSFSSHPR